MPNIIVTNSAQFSPYTYEDYIKPVKAVSDEYKAIQEGYDALNTATEPIQDLIGPNDPKAQARYDKYHNDLLRISEEFGNGYLTPQSRRDLLELKKRYTGEITGIRSAYEKAEKWKENYAKVHEKDSTIKSTIDPDNVSIDSFLDNPLQKYQLYSGAEVQADVYKLASNLLRENDLGTWKSLLGSYYDRIETRGKTSAEIMNTIIADAQLGKPGADEALSRILNMALSTRGITEEAFANNPQAYRDLREAGESGFWSALGDSKEITLSKPTLGSGGGGSSKVPFIAPALRPYAKADATGASTGQQISTILEEISDINSGKKPGTHTELSAGSMFVSASEPMAAQLPPKEVDDAQNAADKLTKILQDNGYSTDENAITVSHNSDGTTQISVSQDALAFLGNIKAGSITMDYDFVLNNVNTDPIKRTIGGANMLRSNDDMTTSYLTDEKGKHHDITEFEDFITYIDGKDGTIHIKGRTKEKQGNSLDVIVSPSAFGASISIPFGGGYIDLKTALETYNKLTEAKQWTQAQQMLSLIGETIASSSRDYMLDQGKTSTNLNDLHTYRYSEQNN